MFVSDAPLRNAPSPSTGNAFPGSVFSAACDTAAGSFYVLIYIYISFMESSDVCFAGYSTGISDANIKNTYTHICHHRVAVPRVLGFPLFIYLFRHLFTFRPKPAARRGGHRGGHRVAQSPIDDEVLHNGRWKLRGDRGQGIHLGTGRPRTWGPERGVFACSCASHATACGVGQEATTNGP